MFPAEDIEFDPSESSIYSPECTVEQAEAVSDKSRRGPRPDSVRRKLRMSVTEILADCKLEPIGNMVELIHDPNTPVNIKADLLKFMASFLHAKKQAAPQPKETGKGVQLNLNIGKKS